MMRRFTHISAGTTCSSGERTADDQDDHRQRLPSDEVLTMDIKGRDLVSKLRTLTVSSDEVREALAEPVNAIVRGGEGHTRAHTPRARRRHRRPWKRARGGGALLKASMRCSARRRPAGVPARTARSVVIGTGKALEEVDILARFAAGVMQPGISCSSFAVALSGLTTGSRPPFALPLPANGGETSAQRADALQVGRGLPPGVRDRGDDDHFRVPADTGLVATGLATSSPAPGNPCLRSALEVRKPARLIGGRIRHAVMVQGSP